MIDELQNILDLQADSIAELPFIVPFEVEDRSMLPEGVVIDKISIYPLKVGTVFRIIPQISKIRKEDLEKISVNPERDFDESAPEVMGQHGDVIIEVICLGIHNKKGAYPEYYPEMLRENCTWKELHLLLNAVLFRFGTMAFIGSTTALMKVGPGAEEIIALQKNLESWKN